MKEEKIDNTLGELQIVNSDINPDEYVSRYRGRFFRGYTDDLLAVSNTEHAFEFSRDGIMHLLPEALFYDEQYLHDSTNKEDLLRRTDELKKKREQLSVFFEAFDTIFERRRIELQRSIDSIESNKEEFVLKEMYDIDIRRIRNVHVRKLARLLLDADRIKGNLHLIPFFVRSILDAKISCRSVNRVVDATRSIYHTELQFLIFINDLSSSQYRQKMDELDEFFWYLEQWFLPFDCEIDFCIKDYHQDFVLGQQMTLDYNIQL